MISADNKIVSRMVGRARPRGEGPGRGGVLEGLGAGQVGVGAREGLPGAPGVQPGGWGAGEAIVGSSSRPLPTPTATHAPVPGGRASPVRSVPEQGMADTHSYCSVND